MLSVRFAVIVCRCHGVRRVKKGRSVWGNRDCAQLYITTREGFAGAFCAAYVVFGRAVSRVCSNKESALEESFPYR